MSARHQAAADRRRNRQNQAHQKRAQHRRKAGVIAAALVVLLMALATWSNPDKEAHIRAWAAPLGRELARDPNGGRTFLDRMARQQVMKNWYTMLGLMDQHFVYHNRLLYSYTTVEGIDEVITYGYFGSVSHGNGDYGSGY